MLLVTTRLKLTEFFSTLAEKRSQHLLLHECVRFVFVEERVDLVLMNDRLLNVHGNRVL